MIVRIWGSRGSLASGIAHTSRFGSNTSCIEVHLEEGGRIIFDAGTGIYALGRRLRDLEPEPCHVCFSHVHWDHISGLPFWKQLYDSRWPITMAGVRRPGQPSLQENLFALFDGTHFPVEAAALRKDIVFRDLEPQEGMTVGSATVSTCETCHPGGGTAWRVDAEGWNFVFTGDHEWGLDPARDAELKSFFQGAEVLIADSQYMEHERILHRGWGHSCMEDWVAPALEAGVKTLVFTHHDPSRTDQELSRALAEMRRRWHGKPIALHMASDGMECSVTEHGVSVQDVYTLVDCPLCEFTQSIALQTDTHAVLERILTEARLMSRADAGTIYLEEEGMMIFAHSQNDTLFRGADAIKQNYLAARLPINTKSIAGYVQVTGESVNIADVRRLPEGVPYGFNASFDDATGYRTVSSLSVPIKDRNGKILGVLQLINSMLDGKAVPFSPVIQTNIERLAALGASAVERSFMMRESILRMLRISSLHDPMETASHVMRVSAVAAEVYQMWAERKDLPQDFIHDEKANIRLASMLHDVGKVGIPHSVLKKPGKLTDEEFAIVKSHCAMGAGLFHASAGAMDTMARDIALHHHQKWNGTGYTGSPEYPVLSGTDIPLGARITAVADVYDALVSPRCYKSGWPPEEARAILKKDAGSHFDPEIVDVFLGMTDVIEAIYAKFPFDMPPQEVEL